jgi:hypothetical protein
MPTDEYDEGDALSASDSAGLDLAEGRYVNVKASKQTLGRMADRAHKILLPTPRGYHKSARGYSCKGCGADVINKTAANAHTAWHDWLEAIIEKIGDDVDTLEGELEQLREDLAEEHEETRRLAAASAEQVQLITRLLGPAIARQLDAEEGPDVHEATA